jgi:hypothetical protein
MMRFHSILFAGCTLAVAALAVGQLKLPGVKIPGLDDNKNPITTSLKDAKFEAKDKDGFTPNDPVKALTALQRTPNGGFILQPGYYEATLQTY